MTKNAHYVDSGISLDSHWSVPTDPLADRAWVRVQTNARARVRSRRIQIKWGVTPDGHR
jgi:hypothetical protein